jgi:hypothetical protein
VAAERVSEAAAPVAVEATARRPRARPRLAAGVRALGALLARHWALAALVAAGLVLRAVALVAIYPGTYFSDSNGYVSVAATGTLSLIRVSAYSLFVWPFYAARSAAALIVVQHLLALAAAVLLYALLVRRGVPRWLAALSVAPAVLDAYLISVEHAIMSDAVFHAAALAAIALLLWGERPRPAVLAAAGLLLGYAGVVRSVGAPFFAVFVLYLLVRRLGWRSLVAFAAPWVLVTVGYAALFDVQHGHLALNQWGARYLYARVAPLADCSRLTGLPADERSLCPGPGTPVTTQGFLWGRNSPIHGLPHSADPRIRDFAVRVVRARPVAYARMVAADVTHYFEPGHRIGRNDYSPVPWEFPRDPARAVFPGFRGPIRPAEPRRGKLITPNRYVGAMAGHPHTNATASRLLRGYQRFAYTSGQVLALCLLVVLVALLRRGGAWRLRLDAALLAAATVVALVVAGAVSLFSYRYGLTAVILLPAAAALAGTSLLAPRDRAA